MHASQFVAFLRKLKLNKVFYRYRRILPRRFRKWIEDNTYRVFVAPEQIIPQYRKALIELKQTVGENAIGDYLEFGVCHGTSLKCMHQVLEELKLPNVRIFGFDSFEGLPDTAQEEGLENWEPGSFASPIGKTKLYLTKNGIDWGKTFLIKGWYSDTLTENLKKEHHITKASVIMVDCDIYSSSKESLDFCKSLIKDTSIVFFDDWYAGGAAEKNVGQKKALDEFLVENANFKVEDYGTYSIGKRVNGQIYKFTNTAIGKAV